MSVTLNGTSGLTFSDATTQSTSAFYGGLAFRNRIINGSMMIDQRNAGASVTPVDSSYTLDRWKYYSSQASKFTAQQNAGSVTPPTGFRNYLGYTVASSVSVGSSDYFVVNQGIEGFNVFDLAWGTASAAPITLSFWVRSSLTGTFSGSVINAANNRSYVFTYTISSANTWEQKSVSIAGDTTGTWLTNNSIGVELRFNLGVGSGSFSQAAGSWGTGNAVGVSTSVSVVGTNGATFYITGVQLEKGSTATSFDYRPYGTELALCQRYTIVYANQLDANNRWFGYNYSGTSSLNSVQFPVTMRTTPTATISTANTFTVYSQNASGNPSAVTLDTASAKNANISATITTNIGLGTIFAMNDSSNKITFSAEL